MNSTNATALPKPAETTLNGAAGSTVVQAIEQAYAALREVNPDLPEVLFVTGTGLMGLGAKWGHFWADAWTMREGRLINAETGALPEIFIAGERLECGAEATFATIVHEATHALAVVRGVKDTSRGNRYHNRRFVALAEELGMEWPEGKKADATIGFSAVVLRAETVAKYREVIDALDAAIVAHMDTFKRLGLVETGGDEGEGSTAPDPEAPRVRRRRTTGPSRSNLKATCGCGRIIRASASVLEAAGITCSQCGEEFTAE